MGTGGREFFGFGVRDTGLNTGGLWGRSGWNQHGHDC